MCKQCRLAWMQGGVYAIPYSCLCRALLDWRSDYVPSRGEPLAVGPRPVQDAHTRRAMRAEQQERLRRGRRAERRAKWSWIGQHAAA